MTENTRTIERYLEGFRRTDRAQVLSCLTDDVEWDVPGLFTARGREAFGAHLVEEGFAGSPRIALTRLIEQQDVVVAEGTVDTQRADGTVLHLAFCDVFEMQGGRIRRLVSYLMTTPGP